MSHQQEALAVAQETETVAQYLCKKFHNLQVRGYDTDLLPPMEWTLEYLMEVDLAANVIWRAFQNRSATTWDVRRYSDRISLRNNGQCAEVEGKLLDRFPPIHTPSKLEINQSIVTDLHGNILLWYLPGILTPDRSSSVFGSLTALEGLLKVDKSKKCWRTSAEYYRPASLKAGTVSLSPAWFEQAHERDEDLLKVSPHLKSRTGPAASWLQQTKDFTALVGGILSIIQPDLYKLGYQALRDLANNPNSTDSPVELLCALRSWYSPFSALSVISNRITPLHRDLQGRPEWFDMLIALGEYDHGRLSLPGLGLVLRYNPGTIAAFSGKILQHGATCPGNRACIAYYMRDTVLERLKEPHISWTNIKLYTDTCRDIAGSRVGENGVL